MSGKYFNLESAWFHAHDTSTSTKPGSSTQSFTFHVEDANIFFCDPSYSQGPYKQITAEILPHNIDRFSTWWNALADRPLMLFSASRLDRRGFGTGSVQDLWIDGPGGGTPANPEVIALSVHGTCKGKSSDPQDVLLVAKDYKFGIKIMAVKRATVTQKSLSDRLPNPTPFDKAFPDLAREARGREKVDFSALAPQIYADAAKGDEAFDAFGIKIPSEQVTGWGIIVLIGIQLYLVMYLSRLSNKLKPDDPGWDAPWMAMDQSVLAKAMLFASLLILPVSAAFFVVIRAASGLFPKGWTWQIVKRLFLALNVTDRAQLVLVLVGFLVSVTLSVVSWKYRPTLAEPATSIILPG
jgi:hypothetical protein